MKKYILTLERIGGEHNGTTFEFATTDEETRRDIYDNHDFEYHCDLAKKINTSRGCGYKIVGERLVEE